MKLVSKWFSSLAMKNLSLKQCVDVSKIATTQLLPASKSILNGFSQRNFATEVNLNEHPPPAKFIKLSEGTKEDFKAAQEHFSKVASTKNTVDRWMNMLEVFSIS